MTDLKSLLHMTEQMLTDISDNGSGKAFKEDVRKLMALASDQSLPGITAEVWLDKLTDMSPDKLQEYVRQYRPGLLNPWTVNP